jgi:hypothetical protein
MKPYLLAAAIPVVALAGRLNIGVSVARVIGCTRSRGSSVTTKDVRDTLGS